MTYDLTDHCNLSCAGCDHASPWREAGFASLESFVRDFRALCSIASIDELTFAGGEPLLHGDLKSFLRITRKEEFARTIRIFTNGLLACRLTDEILCCVDSLIISVYPGVRYRVDWQSLEHRSQRRGVFVGVVERPWFNNALLNSPIRCDETVEAIHRGCALRVYCHTVHDGRYYRCPRAHSLEPRSRIVGSPVKNRAEDSVNLHGDAELRPTLASYLSKQIPLRACHYCLGTFGAALRARQLSRREREAEQQARQSDPSSLLDPSIDIADPPLPAAPSADWLRTTFEPLGEFLSRSGSPAAGARQPTASPAGDGYR